MLTEKQKKPTAFKVIPIQQQGRKELQPAKVRDGSKIWTKYKSQVPLCYQQSCPLTQICENGFLDAIKMAYNYHGDLKLTPDDVWIAIILYFSEYVNDYSEQLRKAFVKHEGKKKLTVVTQYQDLDKVLNAQKDWDQFFEKMISQIVENSVPGVTDGLKCDFSTSDKFEAVFSTALIMNTFQHYFEYERQIQYLCGIENVHLGGTLEDWKRISTKLQALNKYDVNGRMLKYIENLQPVIAKFIETYEGKVDVDFWNKIFNQKFKNQGSGGGGKRVITGWVLAFLGFTGSAQNPKMNEMSFPIEIDNKFTSQKKSVELKGGFKGYSQEGHVFRPHLSFSIIQ